MTLNPKAPPAAASEEVRDLRRRVRALETALRAAQDQATLYARKAALYEAALHRTYARGFAATRRPLLE